MMRLMPRNYVKVKVHVGLLCKVVNYHGFINISALTRCSFWDLLLVMFQHLGVDSNVTIHIKAQVNTKYIKLAISVTKGVTLPH